MPRHRTAIVYDFDGTLAPGNIQEHSFLPELDVDKGEFWAEVGAQKEQHDADELLVYMRLMLERARAKGVAVTKEALAAHGRDTPLFAGVETWFERMNAYAAGLDLALEHYVVSSGNEEIIQGSPIARYFAHIYGSKFIFEDRVHFVAPGDYSEGSQLEVIVKGILGRFGLRAREQA